MTFLPFLAALALTGCTTIKKYKPQAEGEPAHDEDYPIYIYPPDTEVPRPYEVLGTMLIRETPLTLFGGKLEQELNTLRRKTRKVGGDAVRITKIERPGFMHASYRMDAELLRFQDEWERVPFSEQDFRDYLRENGGSLDPIEGLWTASDAMETRVGIVRVPPGQGRDFVAFLIENANPTWEAGDVKLELRSGERGLVYRGVYYHDDYQQQSIAFRLQGPDANVFVLPLSEEAVPIIVTKEVP